MASISHNLVIEYLSTTAIGAKGQLTIPKQFRDDLGLEVGAPFTVLRLGNGLILLPEQRRFEQLCRRIASTLEAAGISVQDLLASLPRARKRVFERKYGTHRMSSRNGRK